VVGWVQNLPDGRVEAVFEGTPEQVQAMIDWCRHGPPSSRVDIVEVIEERPRGDLTDFDIAYTRGW
jgi:acylphosphatase